MDGHRDTELYILSVSTDTHTVLHIHFSKITFIFGKQGVCLYSVEELVCGQNGHKPIIHNGSTYEQQQSSRQQMTG